MLSKYVLYVINRKHGYVEIVSKLSNLMLDLRRVYFSAFSNLCNLSLMTCLLSAIPRYEVSELMGCSHDEANMKQK